MNSDLPSLKSVCASIQREEVRRKIMSSGTTTNAPEVRAYLSHLPTDQRNYKGKRPDLKCDYCKSIGHTMDRCWSLHPELKPKFTKDKKGGNQKPVPNHKALVATHTAESFCSNPITLLNDFASYLQKKNGQGLIQDRTTNQGHDELTAPAALLSKFANFLTDANNENSQDDDMPCHMQLTRLTQYFGS
ncbi:Zinc finger CCHC-type protein [Dioscorea alata]|uniref:Zinc finger CCHC-type protein n=1 Tax=Dioscorea alata TaxID=55571 RepID=A0ACB7UF38_DIOAL|nr:Zinc finger CCHC-type protein [Dioscorea alata]